MAFQSKLVYPVLRVVAQGARDRVADHDRAPGIGAGWEVVADGGLGAIGPIPLKHPIGVGLARVRLRVRLATFLLHRHVADAAQAQQVDLTLTEVEGAAGEHQLLRLLNPQITVFWMAMSTS